VRNRGGPCCESHDCLGASAAGTACVNFAPWLQPGGVALENADVSRKTQRKQRALAGKSMHKGKNAAKIQVIAENARERKKTWQEHCAFASKCMEKEEKVAPIRCFCMKNAYKHGKMVKT